MTNSASDSSTHDQTESDDAGRGDIEEQPFDVNGPSETSGDETPTDDAPEPGRDLDIEEQPFNVNGSSGE